MSGSDFDADASKSGQSDDTQMWPVGAVCASHTGCVVAYSQTSAGSTSWKFTLPAGNGRTLWFCQIRQIVNGEVMQETDPYQQSRGQCHPVVRASAKTTLQDCAEFLLGVPYGWNTWPCPGKGKQKEVDLDCSGLCCEARVLQGSSATIRGLYHGSTLLVNGSKDEWGVRVTTTTGLGEPPNVPQFTPTAHMAGVRRRYHTSSWPHVVIVKSITITETPSGSGNHVVTSGQIVEAQGWDDADSTRPDGTTPHSSAERVVQHTLTTEYPQGNGTQLYNWKYKFSRFIN